VISTRAGITTCDPARPRPQLQPRRFACSAARRQARALWHSGRQVQRLPIHDKIAVASVMNRLGIFLPRVAPGLQDFEHKQVVFIDQPRFDHLAFQVGKTRRQQRRRNLLRRQLRQTEGLELVGVAPRAVADRNHRGRQCNGGDGDHAFAGRTQRGETVIPLTDDASHPRRREFHHHVPRHGHDVGPPLVLGDQQRHRTRFQQPVDVRQSQRFHGAQRCVPSRARTHVCVCLRVNNTLSATEDGMVVLQARQCPPHHCRRAQSCSNDRRIRHDFG
jgi:hypothetical protein